MRQRLQELEGARGEVFFAMADSAAEKGGHRAWGGLLQSFAALFECRFLVSGLQPGSDDGSGFGPGASAKALGPRSLLALAVSGL